MATKAAKRRRRKFQHRESKPVNKPYPKPPVAVPYERFAEGRRCVNCNVPLCSYNPSVKCWEHGGWDGNDLGEAIRALLASLPKVA